VAVGLRRNHRIVGALIGTSFGGWDVPLLEDVLMMQCNAPSRRSMTMCTTIPSHGSSSKAMINVGAGHMQQNADLELPLELNPYEAGLVLERGALVLHRLKADSCCIAYPLCECRGIVGGVRRLAHV
jgi:hypothetical protein